MFLNQRVEHAQDRSSAIIQTGAAVAAGVFVPARAGLPGGRVFAQSSAIARRGTAKPLPARGEFVVRGATVLTMDTAIGDLTRGDVHVRDGAIVAVAPELAATRASVIDARGMICMPGFIDTHWHLWTSVCRAMIQLDDPKRSYFPVTNALGRHFTAEDSYRSARLGAVEGVSAGATTIRGADLAARRLADRLNKLWGPPVIVENIAGAAGGVAAVNVARSKPDGYTLFFATHPILAINPVLYDKLAYDPDNDFASVVHLAEIPTILLVSPSLKVTKVSELVSIAKARPGALNFGSGGVGTSLHLAGELFKARRGST